MAKIGRKTILLSQLRVVTCDSGEQATTLDRQRSYSEVRILRGRL
jgi:hypothetical protein